MIAGYYIHIPFCDAICSYCDFPKVLSHVVNRKLYLEGLKKEHIISAQNHDLSGLKTIYFGGGTPSALKIAELEFLLSTFEPIIKQAKEITFEANPESLGKDKIKLLAQYGVNRVSMGVQTTNSAQLAFLGRRHSMADVMLAIENLRAEGIANINLDLIYALPKQTLAEFKKDIDFILALKPTHLSAYALIIEEHTSLYLDVEANYVVEVSEEVQSEMYLYLQKKMVDHGYIQYEISNWAKSQKFRSQHNNSYWIGSEYLGIGLGSHAYYNNRRYSNTRSITKYMQNAKDEKTQIIESLEITRDAAMEEMLFLGLRLISGVEMAAFFERFGVIMEDVFGTVITKHLLKGNLEQTATHLKLTQKAIFISNEVLSDFLL
ncbi:oxidoreductase [Erysipelotrichaceae bacterium]|nr:oxidoreductase [Erysipelotrichaceae bacterium]